MFFLKLFGKEILLLFIFFSCLTIETRGNDLPIVEIDKTLIGDNEVDANKKDNQSAVMADDISVVNSNDVGEKGNVEIRQSNSEHEMINEVFGRQIQKAKDVSDIKVIKKVKYGSDIADRIDEKYGIVDNRKVNIDRATLKKSGPVKFDVKIKDSAETKTGMAMKDLHDAYECYMSQDYELAIMLYKKALAENPNSVEARFGLGTSYQMLLQFDQAIECYLKILNSKFSRKKVVSNLLLALSHKSNKDALDILLTIDEKILGYDDILSQIGVLYMKLGDDVKAISALTKAYEISPTNVVVLYNLGVLYDRGKNLDYAKHFWELAVKNDVSDILASEDLVKLQKRLKEIDEEILKPEGKSAKKK